MARVTRIRFLKPCVSFITSYPKCSLLVLFIVVWILLPLRSPNWLWYKQVPLFETPNDLQLCPLETSKPGEEICTLHFKALGQIPITIHRSINASLLGALERKVKAGGSWRPSDCRPPFRVAIIIPYRDRAEQLSFFLQHIHPILQIQKLDYQIFVIEQSKSHEFNRGKLFNIGYQESLKVRNFCCLVLHDVDLLPESAQQIYSCSKLPRHMCSAIDVFRYVLPYRTLFGGAIAISKEHFTAANGFSNKFFGWGSEDDDLSRRLHNIGLTITRWHPSISRYTMLSHKKAQPSSKGAELLESELDGEEGLTNLNYKVLDRELRPLYTWILVDVKPVSQL